MSWSSPPPSAEAQLAFLTKLQRLFAEGDFTATYKFALLIALADLALELGGDNGSELILTNRQIAVRFIHLYWRHVSPYSTGRDGAKPGVLSQNVGAQAAVLTAIEHFRATSGVSNPQQASALPQYRALVSRVAATVSDQPLTYLQNLAGSADPFIYERIDRGTIRLKPGMAYCLRRFYPLVQQLSRTHWVNHIKTNRRNHVILGEASDLEDFLFSPSRQSLALIATGLRQLDGNHCFYCNQALSEADVDHYIPFALYPRDLSHNFVLAHPNCNRSKSDTLAARPHLERWLERLVQRGDDLAEIGASAGMAVDRSAIKQVAAWAYGNAHQSQGQAWLAASRYESVGEAYLALFEP